MFTRIATSALFAGFIAGVVAFALQYAFVQPVLLFAELYESGALTHFGPDAGPAAPPGFAIDPMRDGLSLLFSALIYCGYGLLLVAGFALAEQRGETVSARTGAIWGLAGFVAVQLAPAFGLPPELPGMAAGDLEARQIWWFATVAATAAGLWLAAFGRGWAAWGAAIILILAPHVIGAPHPEEMYGPTPPELASLFAARALGVGLAAWAALGLLAGYFWRREAAG